ncbi:hypothetical protein D3C81_1436260 [compost metagenome]
MIVGAHGVFAGGLRPVAAHQHFVLQAGRQHGHAFALGIIDQIGLADAGSGFRLGLRFGLHLLANHAEGGRQILVGNPAFDTGEGIGKACQNGIQAHARHGIGTQLITQLAADAVADTGFVGREVEFAHGGAPQGAKKGGQPSTEDRPSLPRPVSVNAGESASPGRHRHFPARTSRHAPPPAPD